MAKQAAPIEVNNLSRGLITEANALTFPDSASIDEVNFKLSRDGSRRRRYGISMEQDSTPLDTGFLYDEGGPQVLSSFLWSNVGGDNSREILVIQYNTTLAFYLPNKGSISSNLIGAPIDLTDNAASQLELPGIIQFLYFIQDKFGAPEDSTEIDVGEDAVGEKAFGFASINGSLVVTTGGKDIHRISATFSSVEELEDTVTFAKESFRLEIRDLFGVPASYDIGTEGGSLPSYIDLTDPVYVSKRPAGSSLAGSGGETGSTTVTMTNYTHQSNNVIIYEAPVSKFSPSSVGGYKIHKFYITPWGGVTSLAFYGTDVLLDEVSITIQITGGSPISKLLSNKRISGNTTVFEHFGLPSDTELNTINNEGVTYGQLSIALNQGTTESPYVYNLRNQSFGPKRLPKEGSVPKDPINEFVIESGLYPAMGDTINAAFYNNVEESNKTAERFHAEDLITTQQGSYPAPKGHFIIDALDRSNSRMSRWGELIEEQGYNTAEIVYLPNDSTAGGAIAVAEYGGRVWYGGFSEKSDSTDRSALRLDSYLLYSQLVKSDSQIGRCYQSGDPTGIESPELLDTDGGFLKLDGAYGVSKIVPIGNSLVVFAANGVWAISGSDGNYFTPTTPRVQKVTDRGSLSRKAIVVVDTTIVYWAKDGIYLVQVTEAETYEIKNLTETTIQTLYNEIPYTDKLKAYGEYDTYSSTITWVVYNTSKRTQQTMLLDLQLTTGSFTKHIIGEGTTARTLVGPVKVTPYTRESVEVGVLVGTDVVLVNTDEVVVDGIDISSRNAAGELSPAGVSDVKYLVVESVGGVSNISFAEFIDTDFKDWGEVDADAYIVTGYVSGGDHQRYKQVPYITFHFERTEDGFFADTNGDLQLSNPSGCLVQAQWDWANSVNSGRWGREFQAYRYRQLYMPADVNDTFDTGYSTIVTKNKIRGKGRVLSLKISTEEGKDCRILGWSAIMGVNGNV